MCISPLFRPHLLLTQFIATNLVQHCFIHCKKEDSRALVYAIAKNLKSIYTCILAKIISLLFHTQAFIKSINIYGPSHHNIWSHFIYNSVLMVQMCLVRRELWSNFSNQSNWWTNSNQVNRRFFEKSPCAAEALVKFFKVKTW